MGRIQHGTVIKKSGSWYGMYSQWSLNPDGVKIRHQHAFRISGVNEMTKAAVFWPPVSKRSCT